MIDLFLDYSAGMPSPLILRKWAAISMVGGAARRQVSIRTAGLNLYPNLFVLLVAPPGVGKSVAINAVHDLWASTGSFNIAPSAMTKAAMIDSLKAGLVKEVDENLDLSHSLLIASGEFGVLLPGHDLDFLSTLNELFDCRPVFNTRTRSGGELSIDKPHLSLLAGTQPKYLGEILPESAFGLGFTSRIIMVYSAEPVKVPLFNGPASRNRGLESEIVSRLRVLAKARGEMAFQPDAAEAIEAWYSGGCRPIPVHHKLLNYNVRRHMHVLKLSMIFALAEDRMTITLSDFEQARDVLIEAEDWMPEIFKEMSSGSEIDIIEECYGFCINVFERSGRRPIPHNKIIHFLSRKVEVRKIPWILNTMIQAGRLREVTDPARPKVILLEPMDRSAIDV